MSYTRRVVAQSVSPTISTTVEATSISQHVTEVHVTPNADQVVLALLPTGGSAIGGASISLSREQALIVAERLVSAVDQTA